MDALLACCRAPAMPDPTDHPARKRRKQKEQEREEAKRARRKARRADKQAGKVLVKSLATERKHHG